MTEPQPQEMLYISVEDFFAEHPRRGRTLTIPPYNMKVHMVSDCLCMGTVSQVILPLVDGKTPYVFTESTDYPDTHSLLPISYRNGLEHPVEELEEAAPLYPLYAFHNFWHWMFEGLPRLLVLEKFGYDGIYIIAHGVPFIMDLMDLLGIDPKRLRFNDTTYKVRKLMLPHPWSATTMYHGNPELFSLVRSTLLDAVEPLPGRKRCYVRRVGSKRRVINETDVLHTLEAFDFEILVPESLSARQQIQFMTNVDFSVMPHGANCTLAAFQKSGSAFVELFSHRFLYFMNLFMAEHCNLLYVPLCSELVRTTPPPHGYDQDADTLVDCNALRVIVGNMIRHGAGGNHSR